MYVGGSKFRRHDLSYSNRIVILKARPAKAHRTFRPRRIAGRCCSSSCFDYRGRDRRTEGRIAPPDKRPPSGSRDRDWEEQIRSSVLLKSARLAWLSITTRSECFVFLKVCTIISQNSGRPLHRAEVSNHKSSSATVENRQKRYSEHPRGRISEAHRMSRPLFHED